MARWESVMGWESSLTHWEAGRKEEWGSALWQPLDSVQLFDQAPAEVAAHILFLLFYFFLLFLIIGLTKLPSPGGTGTRASSVHLLPWFLIPGKVRLLGKSRVRFLIHWHSVLLSVHSNSVRTCPTTILIALWHILSLGSVPPLNWDHLNLIPSLMLSTDFSAATGQ